MNFQPIDPDVRLYFSYDAETGLITRQRDVSYRFRAGHVAGGVLVNKTGTNYLRLRFRGRTYMQHRLAWFLATGEDRHDLDHKDRDGSNNRLSNLRPATRSQQAANRRGFGRWSKGVYGTRDGTFAAHIGYGGSKRHLGTFKTEDEARAAYVAAAMEVHGEFASF